MSGWWAPAKATSSGLPPVEAEFELRSGRASAKPRRAPRGRRIGLSLTGFDPGFGPIDLTIYGPATGGDEPYEVLVEATLDAGEDPAKFTFHSDRDDRRGGYLAVFRQTDCSSAPVGRCRFRLE